MDMVRTFFTGIVIGMANVIPGISGGTLAVVFNIYDKFVNAVTFNVRKLWANRRFVGPLLTGMLLGVLLFSKLVTVLYSTFPVQTNYAFTGLILGSIPLLVGYTFQTNRHGSARLTLPGVAGIAACVAAGVAIILALAYLEGSVDRSQPVSSVLPPLSVRLSARIFIAGIIGAIAMIIPGISGSLVMLILGVYTIVMASIPALFSWSTVFHATFLLLPNGIGVLLGLLCGARLVSYLLRTVPGHTYAVILGLLCGSAVTLFPGIAVVRGFLMALACALCLAGGAALAFFFSRTSGGEEPATKAPPRQ